MLVHEAENRQDQAARIRSYCAQGAGRVWSVIPTHPKLKLTDRQVEQAARLQLGALPAPWMYQVEGELKCRGCHKVDYKKVPSHAGHCPADRRGPTNDRHNAIAVLLQSVAHQNLVPAVWTPYLEGSAKVTDVGFHLPSGFLHTDITVVDPTAPSKKHSPNAWQLDPAHAAMVAAGAKITKYEELINVAQGEFFLPLAFQTSGGYTPQVNVFITLLAELGIDNCVANPVSAKHIRDWLAIVIQRGNAVINLHGASRMRADSPAFQQLRITKRQRARRLAHGYVSSAGVSD